MLALIDGDVIAHSSCKYRIWEEEEHSRVREVVANPHEIVFTQEEDYLYFERAYEKFIKTISVCLENCWADDFLMAVKSTHNFRDEMYPGYKMNRHGNILKMNPFVPLIRRKALMDGHAIEAVGREADDMLRMWASQAEQAGTDYVIVSIDKDLDCIPGAHWNPSFDVNTKLYRNIYHVEPKDAVRFFYLQLLMGDQTDNIPGCVGIGPVKANKILANLQTEEEFQEAVVATYWSAYPDGWYDMLMSNGKMLYLQKHESDFFSAYDWPVVKYFAPWKEMKAKASASSVVLTANQDYNTLKFLSDTNSQEMEKVVEAAAASVAQVLKAPATKILTPILPAQKPVALETPKFNVAGMLPPTKGKKL